MNKAQRDEKDDVLSEEKVAEYLENHPHFFDNHPKALDALVLEHNVRPAVSLIERQVMMLREKNKHYEKRFRQLMIAARDNERLSKSMHRLALDLLGTENLDDTLASIHDEFRDELHADFVEVRILTKDESLVSSREGVFVAEEGEFTDLLASILNHNQASCECLTKEQLSAIFRENADEVASSALVPLGDVHAFALLALGSRDPKRFHAAMGTTFLSQIGELCAASLSQKLND